MFISPLSNVCFKELFRNKTVRKYFLSDVLGIPPESIQSLRTLNPYLRQKRPRQKFGILDVVLELNNEVKINIELQVRPSLHWDKRQIFYLSRLYTEDMLSGEDYATLCRCIAISVLDFNLTDRPECHSVYRLRDKSGNEFSDIMEVHVLELRKTPSLSEPAKDWIRFFNVRKEEDLDMIKTINPGVREAIQEIRKMGLVRIIRFYHEEHLKAIRDERAILGYAREQAKKEGHGEGLSLGREEGLSQGREEGLSQGREEGLSQGREEGLSQGENRFAALTQALLAQGRTDDLARAAADPSCREQLYSEFGL